MRTKTIKRHYCDHCGKGGFFRSEMAKHESGCTKNPNRVCGMCRVSKVTQSPLPELIAVFNSGGMTALREKANNCPACLLTVVRALSPHYQFDEDGMTVGPDFGDFSFKRELAAWWTEINEANVSYNGNY